LRVIGPDGAQRVTPGWGGAFLLVYEGRLGTSQVKVKPE
jgi:hypothetical protein